MLAIHHTESPFYCHPYNTQGLKPGDLVRTHPQYIQWLMYKPGWTDATTGDRIERRYSDDAFVPPEQLQVGTIIDAQFKLVPQEGAVANSAIPRPSLPSDPTRKISDVFLLVQFVDKRTWLSATTLERIGPYIP